MQRNKRLVWDETIQILEDVFQNEWGDKEVVDVKHIMDLTVPVSARPVLSFISHLTFAFR